MPAGFFWDGILLIIIGLAGMAGIGYLQMFINKLRVQYRRKKTKDTEDSGGDTESVETDIE